MPHHEHHHGHDQGHYHHHHEHNGAGFAPRHGPRHGEHGGRAGRHGSLGFDDEGGMPRGRKLSSDDLQLLLLALVAEQPSHGYELIKALETRSNGFYVPSPGMMYPALACMEDRGHVTIQLDGNRKLYAPSDDGRAHLEANRERVDVMFAKLEQAAQKMALMRNALDGARSEDKDDARGGRGGRTAALDEARHALRHALHARADASGEEQERIAAILARATAEIEGGAPPAQ
jgi:DNA-binding PadR family transcriptional regulator